MHEESHNNDRVGDPYSVTVAKIILFVSTVIVAGTSFSITANLPLSPAVLRFAAATVSAAIAVLLHVFAGARAVKMAEQLMAWGFPAEYGSWSTESRLFCGSIWLLVLAFWAVVSTFNRTVTKLYK